jgi:glycosyltransferase involved in cell wall biosynthesis
MAPHLSIVTVNLDDREGLARTLASVARQTFTDREVVVVDGGSKDGSVEVIRANAAVVTDWVSEPDAGIYDAQNKGILRSRGTYCLFLNAGDSLPAEDTLAAFFAQARGEDVLYGDVLFEREDGSRRLEAQPDEITLPFLFRTTLHHQAVAIRRELFERIGRYDTSFRIMADYHFFLRAIVVHGASTRHVPVPLAVQVLGGLSSRPESFAALREERARARRMALSPVLLAFWEEYLRARRGPLLHWARGALRPLARQLRSLSRSLRGRPDSPV